MEPDPAAYVPVAPEPRRRPLGVVAVAVAVAAVLVAGVAAVATLTQPASNTPDEAVNGLLTAAANADVLGALGHIAPAERDAVSGFLTSATSDLERLGVLAPSTDLHQIGGVKVTFDNVTMTDTQLRDGLTTVTVTGGTVHSHIDPSQLPIGPYVRTQAASSLATATPKDTTSPIKATPVVTVRDGDMWYVSLGYTAAEAARKHASLAFPSPAGAVAAKGASSATGAVDAFIRALASLDLERMIELTPPDEMAALHEYAPLFLPKAQDAIAKLKAGPKAPVVNITDLELSSSSISGGELVKVTKLGFTASSGSYTVTYDATTKCLNVTSTDPNASLPIKSSCALKNSLGTSPFAGLAGLHPDLGIVAVDSGGQWFVSPLRTTFDNLAALLHALTPELIKSLSAGVTSLMGLGLLGVNHSASFSAVGSSLGSSSGAPIGTTLTKPVIGPCVNGKRTVTLTVPKGSTPQRTVTVPCRQAPGALPGG